MSRTLPSVVFRRQLASWLLSVLFLSAVVYLLYSGVRALDYDWKWFRIWRYFGRFAGDSFQPGPLLGGMAVTAKLSVFALVLAIAIGVLLTAARKSALRSLRICARSYTELIRGTPQLVQLYIFYFLFTSVLNIPAFWMGVVSLGLFEAAFAAEIFRAGIEVVPAGQSDAAKALGMRPAATLHRIVLPQMLPLVLPSLANLLVNLIKHSAIVTVIAVPDLTDVARNLIAETFLSFELWLAIACVYLIVCYSCALLIRRWEASIKRSLRARNQHA